MNWVLGALQLGKRSYDVLAKGPNLREIWARFQRGGIFQETHHLVELDERVHCEKDRDDRALNWGR